MMNKGSITKGIRKRLAEVRGNHYFNHDERQIYLTVKDTEITNEELRQIK